MFKNLNGEVKKTEYKTKTIKNNKGITLIALVITIIVLLILAGVAIATLLGDNGIITRATTAKEKTQQAGAVERVQMEVQGSYGTDGNIDINELNDNLKNIDGIKGVPIDKLPATVTLDGLEIEIDANGNVSKKMNLAEAKTTGKVFGDNTPVTDSFGNTVVLPAGFKMASDSADNVTGGIVIEDATYENTKGSQFVWISVGDVYTDTAKTEENKKKIELKRYVFYEWGDIDESLSKAQPKDQLKESLSYRFYYTEGLKEDSTENTHAKDIEAFIRSATNNHGYYIGRYEARKDKDNNLTEVGKDKVYNEVSQSTSAEKSKDMYTNGKFTSDLMNSYAWDTAIVFEQEFDDRKNKDTKYSKQRSLYSNWESLQTGSNNIENIEQQDKICNIWDMASNCTEWTTETYSKSNTPCVCRGGNYRVNGGVYYTSSRCEDDDASSNYIYGSPSFRPILYL